MKNAFFAGVLLASGVATGASAQSLENMTIEGGLSTLGLYIAPKLDIAGPWGARAALYLGSFSDNFDVDGNDIDGKLTSNSGAIMADYSLGNSGLRLSGGLSLGGYQLEGTATTLTIEGNTYTGNFAAELKQKRDVAPVLAIGYARTLGNNWGIVAEIGARFTSLELTTTGQDSITNPTERAQFDADLAQANSDLSDIKILPFITLGVSYKF
ncbi:hypothetical protein ABWH93_07515 [Seohaeicola saemankumensis]|uniref:hypothetical protein n=1 Tax=Seohaeicola TaxID=481178 RepID=UPI0035CF1A3B|nr:hypothetical protein [Paracoccaceae bacterium]